MERDFVDYCHFNVTTLEPANRYAPSTDSRLCDRGTHNAVLLVHGFRDSATSMEPMRRWLITRGWNASAITLFPSDGTATLEDLAKQLARYVNKSFPAGRVDLVGFSMGPGLPLLCATVERGASRRSIDHYLRAQSGNLAGLF